MTGTATIARGLSKRYGRRRPWVLDQVDLELEPGTFTVVVGANGCGKSTLLRVLAGVSHPERGAVTKRPRRVGYVPERLPARLPMTARAYLGHMGRLHRLDAAETARRAEQLADRLVLDPGLDMAIGSLSKGNRQKVMLAQALLAPVGLLLLDEPWAGLDSTASQGLRLEVAGAREAGTAVLATAHLAEAIAGADRALELAGGHLQAVAPGPCRQGDVRQMVTELVPPRRPGLASEIAPWMAPLRPALVGDRWRFVLPAGRATDQVLARALSEGWSVHLVGPIGPGPGAPAGGVSPASQEGPRGPHTPDGNDLPEDPEGQP